MTGTVGALTEFRARPGCGGTLLTWPGGRPESGPAGRAVPACRQPGLRPTRRLCGDPGPDSDDSASTRPSTAPAAGPGGLGRFLPSVSPRSRAFRRRPTSVPLRSCPGLSGTAGTSGNRPWSELLVCRRGPGRRPDAAPHPPANLNPGRYSPPGSAARGRTRTFMFRPPPRVLTRDPARRPGRGGEELPAVSPGYKSQALFEFPAGELGATHGGA